MSYHRAVEMPGHSVVGFVDGIADTLLAGWAFDPQSPSRFLAVDIRTDRDVSVTVAADRYRADVHALGIGDGHCGFSVALRELGQFSAARIVISSIGAELPGSPVRFCDAAPPLRMIGSAAIRLDSLCPARMAISGWAVDVQDPSQRCKLSVRMPNGMRHCTRATLYRSDIALPNVDGFHGFHFEVPLQRGTTLEVMGSSAWIPIETKWR